MIMTSVRQMTVKQLARVQNEVVAEQKRRESLNIGQKVWYDGDMPCKILNNDGDGDITIQYTGYKPRSGFTYGAIFTTTERYIEAR